MAFNYSPKVITGSGLVLCLDAANTKSLVSGSSVWTDMANGYTGALNNNTFDSANGGSLLFDGATSYVQLSAFRSVTSFTIEFWFNSAGSGFQYGHLIGSSGANRLLHANGSRIFLAQFGVNHFSTGVSRPHNTWNCVHYVYNNAITTGQWFINSLADSTYVYPAPITLGTTTKLGVIDNVNYWFNGKVSRVLIYDRVLSSSEISQNYNAIKPRYEL